MIDYRPSWLDADLEMYRDTVSRFVEREMAPLDEEARKQGNVGHELWLKAGALGLLCSDIPAEYGGGGGDFRHEAIFYDAMSRRGLTGMNPSVHTIVAHYLLNHGTEEQKREYLPRLASGELVGAIAMTEPGAGSDLQSIRTRAEKRGGNYVINGSKTFISNGLLAGLVLVVAKTNPAERASGMSIILVETAKAPGFRVGRVLDKLGLKAQDTSELFFDEVVVPTSNLLGGVEGRGFYQLMSDLPYERTVIGVMAVAAMEGALEATLAFVRERKAFGKAIAEFQNTKYRLAELATATKVTRSFVDQCVEALVSGTLDAATASMAKLWASEQQGKVIDECLQLHGGYGFMNEYLIARMYADARVQRIYGGTSEMMKEVISRSL
ncbi:acyl-CoA dehydrogenase family protein [Bradyrhizobium sp. Cp5.3]|uniref:acyl-CoA dehydrogenase family protein n=1 Tax=Bradyrhizobium sp. Cp5.3 TaxID=443598 RepID=UPI0004837B39|nr:acyl-CoA dehydrogenase family protein [Bradyrhizobium sp. Cp5.3]